MKIGKKIKKALVQLSDHVRKNLSMARMPYAVFRNQDNGDITLVIPAPLADDGTMSVIEKALQERAQQFVANSNMNALGRSKRNAGIG